MARWRHLTDKQAQFVEHYIVNRNPIEAYKHAYDVTTQNQKSIAVKASQVLMHEMVKQAIENAVSKKARRTIEDLIEDLRTIYAMAITDRDLKAAIACISQEAKLLGYDRLTINHEGQQSGTGQLTIKIINPSGEEGRYDNQRLIEIGQDSDTGQAQEAKEGSASRATTTAPGAMPPGFVPDIGIKDIGTIVCIKVR